MFQKTGNIKLDSPTDLLLNMYKIDDLSNNMMTGGNKNTTAHNIRKSLKDNLVNKRIHIKEKMPYLDELVRFKNINMYLEYK